MDIKKGIRIGKASHRSRSRISSAGPSEMFQLSPFRLCMGLLKAHLPLSLSIEKSPIRHSQEKTSIRRSRPQPDPMYVAMVSARLAEEGSDIQKPFDNAETRPRKAGTQGEKKAAVAICTPKNRDLKRLYLPQNRRK